MWPDGLRLYYLLNNVLAHAMTAALIITPGRWVLFFSSTQCHVGLSQTVCGSVTQNGPIEKKESSLSVPLSPPLNFKGWKVKIEDAKMPKSFFYWFWRKSTSIQYAATSLWGNNRWRRVKLSSASVGPSLRQRTLRDTIMCQQTNGDSAKHQWTSPTDLRGQHQDHSHWNNKNVIKNRFGQNIVTFKSRLSEMAPFDRSHASFCSSCIVTVDNFEIGWEIKIKSYSVLENEYSKLRKKYVGFPSSDISFDTELVSKTFI